MVLPGGDFFFEGRHVWPLSERRIRTRRAVEPMSEPGMRADRRDATRRYSRERATVDPDDLVNLVGRRPRPEKVWFEVIAGKSLVSFHRDGRVPDPSGRCFAFVQTVDDQPRARLVDTLRQQGMQPQQQVAFLSDGADTLRRLQQNIAPEAEHVLDLVPCRHAADRAGANDQECAD
jgi:hypothetical protein